MVYGRVAVHTRFKVGERTLGAWQVRRDHAEALELWMAALKAASALPTPHAPRVPSA